MKLYPIVALILCAVNGCMVEPNPSLPITFPQGQAELKAMQADRKPLTRPVVVIDGFLDPGFGSRIVAGWVGGVTSDADQVIRVNLIDCCTFDACREKIIETVEAAFPWSNPRETREVDVVAISMGGLAARYAALPGEAMPIAVPGPETRQGVATTSAATTLPAELKPTGKRLKIARLFTLSTPHQGAILADAPTRLVIPVQRDMCRGSPFLAALNAHMSRCDYPIIPYIRLTDDTIGLPNAAPPGQTPIWVPTRPCESAHIGVVWDARIAADICRRLRGETPMVTEPLAPPPK